MALPTIFANLTAGNQPASLIDGNFNAVGAMGVVACTAAGTNTIVLTPIANQTSVGSPRTSQLFSFVAPATSTGPVQLNAGLGALNLYLDDGVTQATTGSVVINSFYLAAYSAALNAGAGGYYLVNSQISTSFNPSPITNSLTSSVLLNNTANFFDGPTVAQGSTGTWFASGSVELSDSTTAGQFLIKLWDGTTNIDTRYVDNTTVGKWISVSLSGFIVSPAGNLRISVKDQASTGGIIGFNISTITPNRDSTITAFRIA